MAVQTEAFLSYDTGHPDRKLVLNGQQAEEALRVLDASPALVLDHETSGTSWWAHSRACGLALAGWDGPRLRSYYFPWAHDTGERCQLDIQQVGPGIGRLLASDKLKIAHHAAFELHFCRQRGWKVGGPLYDTMVAAHLVDPDRLIGLKDRAEQDLGRKDAHEHEERVKARVATLAWERGLGLNEYRERYGYSQVPVAVAGPYACLDVEYTGGLYQLYEGKMGLSTGPQARVTATEMRLVRVLADMEERGMLVDAGYLIRLRELLRAEAARLQQEIYRLLGFQFDLGSDEQLRDLLCGRLHLPLTKLTKSRACLSVDAEVLEENKQAHPAIPLILQWRETDKIQSTYTGSILERLDGNSVLHSAYQQVGAATARMSCRQPNFQNQPTDDNDRAIAATGLPLEKGGKDPWSVRRAFVVPKGMCRVFMDYSQIELRVMAFYSRDPNMVDAYQKGEDIHSRTSLLVFGTAEKSKRRLAKQGNFGTAYGLGIQGFARKTGVSEEAARDFQEKFAVAYPGLINWKRTFLEDTRNRQCVARNLFGRQRAFPDLLHPDKWVRGGAERGAIASYIQGTAAELAKESMVRIADRFSAEKLEAAQVAVVHDEIQADCPILELTRVVRIMREEMERYPEFAPVPISVEGEWSVESWADKKKLPKF
jgi:DNA polymerase-1